MENTFQEVVLGHITIGMLATFVLGNLSLFLYSWKTAYSSQGVRKYLSLTPPNMLFHIISSFMMLLILHEIGENILSAYLPQLEDSSTYHMTMSCLTGMFGSVFVAWVLEKGKKLIN